MSAFTLPQIAAMISNIDPDAPEELVAVRERLEDTDLSVEDISAVRTLAALDRRKLGDSDPSRAVDAVLGVAPNPEEWPNPTPLGPPDPEPVPLNCLPPTLRNHVESAAGATQTPIDMGTLLTLSAISVAVQGKAEIQIRPGWLEPLNIYTGVVMPPASRKSAVFRHVFQPLEDWEVEQAEKEIPSLRVAEDAREILEKRLEAAKRDAAKGDLPPEAVEAARFELLEAKVTPVTRLNAPEATPEALVKIMAEQAGRIAVLAPEGDPLRIADGRYSGHGDARLDTLKRAWSGESIRTDRIGRVGHHIRRPALTIALCVQPVVLETLRNARSFRGEGVFGRFLWALPPSGIGTRLTGPKVPLLNQEAADEWNLLLRRLLGARPRDVDDDGAYVPHTIHLAPDALDLLHAWEAEVEEALAPGGMLADIPDWGGKLVGNTVRLAGLLHLARTAEDVVADLWGAPIAARAMGSAIELARALRTHAMKLFDSLHADPKRALLQYVLRRIQELPTEDRNLRRLRETCRGKKGIDTADDIQNLVAQLEEHNLVRLVPGEILGPGRPGAATILLHSTLENLDARNTINSENEVERGVSGINGMRIPDDPDLRGRIDEVVGDG